MIKDRFLESLITSIQEEIRQTEAAMALKSFSTLYEVGQLQGRVHGLKQSLQVLERLIEESDS